MPTSAWTRSDSRSASSGAAPLELLGEEVLELDDALLGLEATLVGDHGADGRDRVVAPALEVIQAVDRHVEDVGDDLDRQRHGEGGDEFDLSVADPAVDEALHDGFHRLAQPGDRARRGSATVPR